MKDDILNDQWEAIAVAPVDAKRAAYLKYCQLAIAAVYAERLSISEASYALCGISAQVLEHLAPEDKRIMDIACDLELPEAQRAHPSGDWQRLVATVQRLLA